MLMKRIIILLLIAFTFLPILTSCWDKKELNELAIAVGISIDKSKEGYKLGVQIVNPGVVSPQSNESGMTPVTVRTETGNSIYETLRSLSLTNSRRIYTSHLRLLIISEEVAKDGISDILDFLSRDKDFRGDFIIIIAKGSNAEDLLKVQTITEKISANALYTLLETSGEIWGETVAVNLRELLGMLTTPGKNPVLSGVEVQGNLAEGKTMANTETSDSPAGFNYLGLGIFNQYKLVGWLNEEEGKGYNYITDKIHNTVGHIDCSSGEGMSIEILRSNAKQIAKVTKDGDPEIKLDIRAEANIGETDCSIDLTNPFEIKKLEQKIEKRITQIIEETIHKVQDEYKTDIFGFGETIYRSHPKVWKKVKKDWEENFANLNVEVNVNVSIKQLGTIGNPFSEDIKEQH